eukprot:588377-Pelagomonas_calceolata.AAC.2
MLPRSSRLLCKALIPFNPTSEILQVTGALHNLGVPPECALSCMSDSAPPIPLPTPHANPFAGHWSPAQPGRRACARARLPRCYLPCCPQSRAARAGRPAGSGA